MKRLLPLLIGLFMTQLAYSRGTKVGDLYYILDSANLTAEVTYSTTSQPSYDSRGNYPGLTQLAIPEIITYDDRTYKVTAIGEGAFAYCLDLTGSLTIPNSVTSIGSEAFAGCTGLTGVYIKDLEAWCKIKFDGALSNPLYYAHHLYLNGEEIKDLKVPDSITEIKANAFFGCTGFTGSLTISNSVSSIGNWAFGNCAGFTGSLTIGNSVTSIGLGAFYGCTGFTGTLTIPNSVTSIGESAFYGCTGLTGSLTIPNSVTSIGKTAFYDCFGLTGLLTIPNSVTEIGEYAFYGCSGLTGSLTIPNSVSSIGNWAFSGCTGFTGSLTIGNSVNSIGFGAFYGCTGFTGTLTIPNSVTSIGESAFEGCSGFTGSLTIPNSVTTIGDYAFYDCSGITGSLTIGNSVTSIGELAFYGCTGFTDVTSLSENPPNAENSAFDGLYSNPLYVPAQSESLYKVADEWKNFYIIDPITVEATGIALNKSELILLAGQEYTLTATLTPANATDKTVTWESSDPTIATVSEQGLVTAIAQGTTVITAYDAYGHSAFSIIKVVAGEEDGVELIFDDFSNLHIFTVSGILIKKNASKEDIDALVPGIYIINNKKVIIR